MQMCNLAPVLALFLTLLLPLGQQIKTDAPASETTHYLLKELPAFFPDSSGYRVDPYLRTAAELQAMGKEKGGKLLLALTLAPSRSETTFLLARMLFVPKPGETFRSPYLGMPTVLGGTTPTDWPWEPITLVEGVPFLIVRGYRGTGISESAWQYVEYCLNNCDWNPVKFTPKSAKAKQQALVTLLHSRKWKRDLLLHFEKNFLADQIK